MQLSDHDRPETYSAYHTVAKVFLLDNARAAAVIGLKDTGLDVHFEDGEVLHFDLTGRLQRVARPNMQWRRGLSGRTLRLRRRAREEGGALERIHVAAEQADALVAAAHDRMQSVKAAVDPRSFLLRGRSPERPGARRASAARPDACCGLRSASGQRRCLELPCSLS